MEPCEDKSWPSESEARWVGFARGGEGRNKTVATARRTARNSLPGRVRSACGSPSRTGGRVSVLDKGARGTRQRDASIQICRGETTGRRKATPGQELRLPAEYYFSPPLVSHSSSAGGR
ncbi:hypothetical protein PAHAL_9G060300 [Panicum hallii]|uniref:Uncharacterized protein n=1 Tax=Panicum hallii TaxID=206008 RepID=A0A2T8I0D4_9POAL|nr:hypothetical protein PAHAL_9G060300 [Panicum hallii]